MRRGKGVAFERHDKRTGTPTTFNPSRKKQGQQRGLLFSPLALFVLLCFRPPRRPFSFLVPDACLRSHQAGVSVLLTLVQPLTRPNDELWPNTSKTHDQAVMQQDPCFVLLWFLALLWLSRDRQRRSSTARIAATPFRHRYSRHLPTPQPQIQHNSTLITTLAFCLTPCFSSRSLISNSCLVLCCQSQKSFAPSLNLCVCRLPTAAQAMRRSAANE